MFRQNPNSFMALKWCIEYGVIPADQAKKKSQRLEKMKIERKEQLRLRP